MGGRGGRWIACDGKEPMVVASLLGIGQLQSVGAQGLQNGPPRFPIACAATVSGDGHTCGGVQQVGLPVNAAVFPALRGSRHSRNGTLAVPVESDYRDWLAADPFGDQAVIAKTRVKSQQLSLDLSRHGIDDFAQGWVPMETLRLLGGHICVGGFGHATEARRYHRPPIVASIARCTLADGAKARQAEEWATTTRLGDDSRPRECRLIDHVGRAGPRRSADDCPRERSLVERLHRVGVELRDRPEVARPHARRISRGLTPSVQARFKCEM